MDAEALATRLREIAQRLDDASWSLNSRMLANMSEELESIADEVRPASGPTIDEEV